MSTYSLILTEVRERVGLVRLNRPEARERPEQYLAGRVDGRPGALRRRRSHRRHRYHRQ